MRVSQVFKRLFSSFYYNFLKRSDNAVPLELIIIMQDQVQKSCLCLYKINIFGHIET